MTEPARLLAGRRGMSLLEKEKILDGVLARVAPRAPWRRRLAFGGLAVVAAAAGALVLVPAGGAPRDELVARGGELQPGFEVTCVPAPCTTGSKLVFDITTGASSAPRYFAAVGRRGDALIWYFPSTAGGRSLPVLHAGVLDTGFVLGAEHLPGTYAIEGVFSDAPLDRAAIRTILERGGATATRKVVVQ